MNFRSRSHIALAIVFFAGISIALHAWFFSYLADRSSAGDTHDTVFTLKNSALGTAKQLATNSDTATATATASSAAANPPSAAEFVISGPRSFHLQAKMEAPPKSSNKRVNISLNSKDTTVASAVAVAPESENSGAATNPLTLPSTNEIGNYGFKIRYPPASVANNEEDLILIEISIFENFDLEKVKRLTQSRHPLLNEEVDRAAREWTLLRPNLKELFHGRIDRSLVVPLRFQLVEKTQ